jgi:hypothetical protein
MDAQPFRLQGYKRKTRKWKRAKCVGVSGIDSWRKLEERQYTDSSYGEGLGPSGLGAKRKWC